MDNKLLSVISNGIRKKSIGTAESGFFSRWNWNQSTWSGKTVNEETALQNDTVWACVKLISEAVSTLPLGFFKRATDGSRVPEHSHGLYEILHNQPNALMSAVNFWQAATASLLLWGNAYIEIQRINKRIVALDFLLPQHVTVARTRGGALEYSHGTEKRKITAENMMHIRSFSLDGVMGLSAIQYGRNAIGGAMAADQASDEVFKNSSRATGIITMDAVLGPDQREQIREHVKKLSDAGGLYVLEKGAGYESIRFNPIDAELLASRSFSVETICRWFRVPPVMIGHGDKQSSWPTSTEAQGALFLRYVLRACILGIEQEIRRSLLTPAERQLYFAEFSIEGLLRGDTAARAQFYAQMLQNGVFTRNEVRRLENLAPIPGADDLTVQSNMIPIHMLGKITATTQAEKVLAALGGTNELSN